MMPRPKATKYPDWDLDKRRFEATETHLRVKYFTSLIPSLELMMWWHLCRDRQGA
jgi:hypothetical protein